MHTRASSLTRTLRRQMLDVATPQRIWVLTSDMTDTIYLSRRGDAHNLYRASRYRSLSAIGLKHTIQLSSKACSFVFRNNACTAAPGCNANVCSVGNPRLYRYVLQRGHERNPQVRRFCHDHSSMLALNVPGDPLALGLQHSDVHGRCLSAKYRAAARPARWECRIWRGRRRRRPGDAFGPVLCSVSRLFRVDGDY